MSSLLAFSHTVAFSLTSASLTSSCLTPHECLPHESAEDDDAEFGMNRHKQQAAAGANPWKK